MLERSREKIAHCIDQGETCHTEERGGAGKGVGGGGVENSNKELLHR